MATAAPTSRIRRLPLGAILAALTLTLAIGAWWYVRRATTGGGTHRPNVLLVTIDTLRADHVGAYGASKARTPALDRLAAEGIRCDDAIAAAPITMPSHASLLTGLYPPAHGVHDNGTAALPRDVVTLADRLSGAGYSTHAFVSAVVLSRLYGLDKGFSTYDDDLWSEDAPRLFMIRERTARRTADRFVEWFGRWTTEQGPASASPAPFFTWVHFFDPHQPHEAAPEDRQGAASPYDAEVTAADRGVGRLIETLRDAGALDDTIVIVTSDHGESLGEHGEATHAIFVYDATVRVPLIVRYPRTLPAGKVYDGPVRHIDVVPTLLAMLGLPGGGETQGVDLTAPWQGKAPAPALSQYSESLLSELGFGMAPLHALRKSGFKWIRAPRPELYDLKADARELTNLHPGEADRSAAMDAELDQIMRAAKPHPDQSADGGPMARETMEMLQSLGYLAPSTVRQSMSGIDPKDGIQIYNQLEEARHRAQERKWKEAEAIVREILAKLPNHVAAQNVLGLALVRQRRYPEARVAYGQSLAADPTQFRVHANLGSLALFQHDLDGAEQGFKKALELNPRFIEAMLNLGLVSSLRGDNAGAGAWYRKADGVDPNFPATARRLGDLYYEQGQFSHALASYEHALQLSPKLFPAMVQAGNSARRVGDPAKAAASFARAAELRPDSWVPWYNLACLRATTGDAEGALAALRESVTRGVADPALLDSDPDLAPLRADPRFAALARDAHAR
jgi:arylsulfatase A-like enzyme/Flp pilus assembly protein TadD